MKPCLLIALALLLHPLMAGAQSDAELIFNYQEEKALSELPNHIKPPAFGLALVADFEHPKAGRILVYFINRSDEDCPIETQNGNAYLKLEFQDTDGHWSRAEPQGFSWCGNSYDVSALHKDHFAIIMGYQPKHGQNATVRFRFYKQKTKVFSNAGPGLINRDDIQKAQNDAMMVIGGEFATVSAVARGELSLENKMDHIKDLRAVAIEELRRDRFDRKEAEEVLRVIIAQGQQPYAQQAQETLNALQMKTE